MYVIMCDTYDKDNKFLSTDPVDVVSTMDAADTVCTTLETDDPECIYYWREIISSEE
jgi:hypothetical protein